jgi:dTDP-4-dehydrorhamnose 3,5-epimerase
VSKNIRERLDMIQYKEFKLPDVWLIEPKIDNDHRGNFVELNIEKDYDELPPKVHFVYTSISTSMKGVLRGIHYSPNCWKIYQCLNGSMYYVFVNCDESDINFGKWESIILKPYTQVLKHPRYAAGFIALEDNTILYYAQSQYYNYADPDQQTFRYDDKRFNIWWPKITPVPLLSRRDEKGEYEFRIGRKEGTGNRGLQRYRASNS